MIASHAFGINDAGQVVGRSDTAGNTIHAFITGPEWDRHEGPSWVLRVVISAMLTGINNAGQVVGRSNTRPETPAMLSSLAPMGWA